MAMAVDPPPVLAAAGFAVAAAIAAALAYYWYDGCHAGCAVRLRRYGNLLDTIGDTPLVEIACLRVRGCRVFAKLESSNPGGSVKDRVALRIVEEAIAQGHLTPFSGDLVTEGTAGSTGVSLSMVCRAMGLRCHVVMPDDAALEKSEAVCAFGGEVERVRPVAFANPDHMVNRARRRAERVLAEKSATGSSAPSSSGGRGRRGSGSPSAYFANQFDNLANFRAHYHGTGREIWEQTGGRIDAFVCGAGTGGTMAGVGARLKEHDPRVMTVLCDPPGSSLFNYVTRGVMYTSHEAEGQRLRNPQDTITEGVGINRYTENIGAANIDAAVKCTDAEAVEMARFVLREEGLFIGSSSAVNLVGAMRVAEYFCDDSRPGGNDASGDGREKVIVTVLCDSGERHRSKFHNEEYLASHGLLPTAGTLEFLERSGNRLTMARGRCSPR